MITKLATLAMITLASAAMAMETMDANEKYIIQSLSNLAPNDKNDFRAQAATFIIPRTIDYSEIFKGITDSLKMPKVDFFSHIDFSKLYTRITEDMIASYLDSTINVDGVERQEIIFLQQTKKFAVLSRGVYIPEDVDAS